MKMIVMAPAILSLGMLMNAAYGQMQASPSRSEIAGGRLSNVGDGPANRDMKHLLEQRAAQQKPEKPKGDQNEPQARAPRKTGSPSKSAGDSVPGLDSDIRQVDTARAEAELACERQKAAGQVTTDCSTRKKR